MSAPVKSVSELEISALWICAVMICARYASSGAKARPFSGWQIAILLREKRTPVFL
jgi:hypothetical protein